MTFIFSQENGRSRLIASTASRAISGSGRRCMMGKRMALLAAPRQLMTPWATLSVLQGNLDKLVQHGKRADSIIKNMLLQSRAASGEHRSVDINALVEESLNLAYHGVRASDYHDHRLWRRGYQADGAGRWRRG